MSTDAARASAEALRTSAEALRASTDTAWANTGAARIVVPAAQDESTRAPARVRAPSIGTPLAGLLLWACLASVLAFLTVPVAAVFAGASPATLLGKLGEAQSLQALLLSLQASTVAIAVVVALGTPAAWLLASRAFPGRALATTLVELPLVLPPAVAGIGLLATLGPHGLLGPALARLHVQLVLQRAGVVVALTFVAFPFYVRQAQAAFAAVDRSCLQAAQTLGAGRLAAVARIAVPIALPGLGAGLALAWGRALGEFGATLMFAGSVQGVTQTLSLAIYGRMATDFSGALALSSLLVAVSLGLLLAVKLVLRAR